MGYNLGIDFGTSTTKVALRRAEEIPLALPIGKNSELFMPSLVAFRRTSNDRAETIAIGEDAVVVPETEKTHVVSEVKRCLAAIGTAVRLPEERYPWWNPEGGCIQLWSSRFSPYHIVLTILSEALERAIRRAREHGFGDDVDGFSIRGLPMRLGTSVTASLETRKVLAEVARRLGFPNFKVASLCEEPVLASLAYVHQQPEIVPGETILIYDLGGGTLDIAIVKVHEHSDRKIPTLTIFSADGEPFLGGVDIDEALFKHLACRIAEEALGFKGEERLQILNRMSPKEKQNLWNEAREAKERLSTDVQTSVSLPEFLGESEVMLSLSRDEVEAVVVKTGLIDNSLNCVLRTWRKARMLLRKQGEAIGTFHLKYEKSSGRIEGSVMKLEHEDLSQFVTRILLVGGATRMPIIKRTLISKWGENKIMPEKVVKPIEACSVGAAWQEKSMSAIVDRLPFSIVARWDSGESKLYEAFTPTVTYKTITSTPSINPYRSERFSLPAGCKEISIVYESPDGEAEVIQLLRDLPLGPYSLEVDLFGRFLLRDGLGTAHELPNRLQHPVQREMWEQIEAEARREEDEQRQRLHRILHRRPGEDLHEVG